MFFAFRLAPRMAPSNNAASSATMARTVRSSVKLKPRFDRSFDVKFRRTRDIREVNIFWRRNITTDNFALHIQLLMEISPFVFLIQRHSERWGETPSILLSRLAIVNYCLTE